MAAVLLGGPGAMLSHRSAAELWGLLEPIEGPVHVTVRHGGRRHDGLHLHRSRHLDQCAVRDLIQVTTVSRTLLDLAGVGSPAVLRQAFDEADRRGHLRRAELSRLCAGPTGRPGNGALRALLDKRQVPLARARSRLEERFLRYCRDRGLPIPAVNVPLAGYEVDCLWPGERVAVELDS